MISNVSAENPSDVRAWAARVLSQISFTRLLAAAALLHLLLAIGIFVAGRTQAAPAIIDRDGIMSSFAFDSYDYQREAVELAATLKQLRVVDWVTAPEPVHVKAISICFMLLGPLFGNIPLAAEPFNLFCYLLMLIVVFLVGREVGGHRVALLSMAMVALWPTLLLHSLQLLKDTLFISGALAIVWFVVTWLTRSYRRNLAFAVGLTTAAAVFLLMRVRVNVGLLVSPLIVCGFFLLVVRQLLERRLLKWNMICAAPALLAVAAILAVPANHRSQSFKQSGSNQIGLLKSISFQGKQVATTVVYRSRVFSRPSTLRNYYLWKKADEIALSVGITRSRFSLFYPDAGSSLDGNTNIREFSELLGYLPRAVAVGLWAPFPNSWFSRGHMVGSAGKLLAGAETLVIYFIQFLAIATLFRFRRELSIWLIALIVVFGVTALALLVSNLGALYRFRYTFWILLIILAAKALQPISAGKRLRWSNPPLWVIVAAVLSGLCGCWAQPAAGQNAKAPSQSTPASSPVANRNAHSGFSLTNITGGTIRAIYLSPSDAPGWEENILTVAKCESGDSVDVKFDGNEAASQWDLRVEGTDGRFAEWKNLIVADAAQLTLYLKMTPAPAVVAEIDEEAR